MGLHSFRCEMPIRSCTSLIAPVRPRHQKLSVHCQHRSSLHSLRFYGDMKFLRQNRRWHHRYRMKEELIVFRESSPTPVLVKPISRNFEQSQRPRAAHLSFDGVSDVIGVSTRRLCRENSNMFFGVNTRGGRRNSGLEIIHGLGKNAGLRMAPRGVGPEQSKRISLLVCAAGDKNDSNTTGDDPVETLFMKELRKRGISSDGKGTAGTDTRTESTSGDSRLGPSDSRWSGQDEPKNNTPPPWTASSKDDQLSRSRALNSEGLEGLIPRATELLKLGGSFWIVFWPLILASLATFITLYVYFGSNFLHAGGSAYPGGRPPYIEPYQLLEEETIPSEIGPNRVPYRNDSSP